MTAPSLRVEDLRYTYPGSATPAVDGMSFTVGTGEVFGFLGPSGAGKTTTQRAIIGLLDGWTGEIDLLGKPRRDWGREVYDRIGVAFELPVGYPRLTAREDLTHFANLHDRGSAEVVGLLERVGLSDAVDVAVGSYSKGMRIRLNLARALLHDPDLLFLDEPTAGLDPVNAASVRQLILDERGHGRSVFVTTHDMATAAVCDRVAFVVDGRIVACDDPRALQLTHGTRRLRVEHRVDGELQVLDLPLDEPSPKLLDLLRSGRVETVHTTEADLADVFERVTGGTAG
jgi:fluoroquinolone transport system ATP-binding protein